MRLQLAAALLTLVYGCAGPSRLQVIDNALAHEGAGLAAILDLAGGDRYESAGPTWGSAVAGVSLVLDVSGDDLHEAQDFSLGALPPASFDVVSAGSASSDSPATSRAMSETLVIPANRVQSRAGDPATDAAALRSAARARPT